MHVFLCTFVSATNVPCSPQPIYRLSQQNIGVQWFRYIPRSHILFASILTLQSRLDFNHGGTWWSSDVLSAMLSGILSGIPSDILSGISSGVLSGTLRHIFWHSCCRLRSGGTHWDPQLAVGVRRCPLRSGAGDWGPAVPTGIESWRWGGEEGGWRSYKISQPSPGRWGKNVFSRFSNGNKNLKNIAEHDKHPKISKAFHNNEKTCQYWWLIVRFSDAIAKPS